MFLKPTGGHIYNRIQGHKQLWTSSINKSFRISTESARTDDINGTYGELFGEKKMNHISFSLNNEKC
jgi:hypothetical protein